MTMTHKTFQLRGYCTAAGYDRIREVLAMSATLYNAARQERRDAWTMNHKTISLFDQTKQLTLVRQDDPHWAALDTVLARGALVRIDRAFKAFFRRVKNGEKPGFPRFKPRSRYSTLELSEVRPGMVKTSPTGRSVLKIKGLPNIRIKPSRELPAEGLKAIRITLRNRYLTVDLVYEVETPDWPVANKAVGIDLGVKQRLTLSDGTAIPGIQQDRREVRRLQRAVSRAKKGSTSRRKRVSRLANAHRKTRIRNRNLCHRLTTEIVRNHGHIAVEALRIPNMVKSASGNIENPGTNVAAKSGLNRSISEQTWGIIRQQLRYKAEWAGRAYVEVDPKNTSRTCSRCDRLTPEQEEYRVFRCPSCGLDEDRDLNASINILKRSVGTPLRTHNPRGCAQEDSLTQRPLAG